MKLAVVLAASLAVVTTAHAKPKPIKAQFLCGTFVDGKIKTVITGGKVPKITDPIACAIHVDDPKEPSHMGNVHTVRYIPDDKPGKMLKVTTSGKTTDFGSESENHDFEIVMKPEVPDDEHREIAFAACEDFDIIATVSDDLGVYFTKTIKVQQSCPKPAPIAAQLSCAYEASDGTMFKWPGNGVKAKPRLSVGRELDCSIASSKALPGGTTLTGSLAIKGKPAKTDVAGDRPPSGWAATFAFTEGDYDECADLALEGKLVDANGATRWTGSMKIVQSCPD